MILAAALGVGCVSQPTVQTSGSLTEAVKQGKTYHLDARRSGLAENELRGLREGLQKAGLSAASPENAKLLVTVSADSYASTERHHTGGKNGVGFDRKVDVRRFTVVVTDFTANAAGKVLLEVGVTAGGSTPVESLVAAAVAGLGG